MSEPVRRAEAVLRTACGDRVRTAFSMAPLTTFRIGGPAALYLEAESEDDLIAVGEAVRQSSLPVIVVGKGSNILVSDRGFDGLVLRLGRGFRWAARDGEVLTSGAAMPLPALAGIASSHALSGLEFGVAIPGSVGGAVRMNAGAHGREIAQVVRSVDVFELGPSATRRIQARDVAFRYRSSSLPAGGVVTAAAFALATADAATIRTAMDEARSWRRRTQPLAEPNCGSVFKNPPGDHAARLIDAAGGKALRVGGAAVSSKHANFIVTSEGAKATDVVELIRSVQDLVAARFDLHLEPEVHLVGAFDLVPR